MEPLIVFFEAERGRRIALARFLDLSPATISQWRRVPAVHCIAVEGFSGISRHHLRPDIYGPAPLNPAKVSAAPSPSVSQSDAEPRTCLTETRSHPTENRSRAIA